MISHKFPPTDLLRRFIATPYVFTGGAGRRLLVQSNDLEIALAVRRNWIDRNREAWPSIISFKLIRDVVAGDTLQDTLILRHGTLRTLLLGTKTILVFDVLNAEVLGFISANTTVKQLVSSLIPMLMDISAEAACSN